MCVCVCLFACVSVYFCSLFGYDPKIRYGLFVVGKRLLPKMLPNFSILVPPMHFSLCAVNNKRM